MVLYNTISPQSRTRTRAHVVGVVRWDNPRSGVFKRFMTVSSRLISSISDARPPCTVYIHIVVAHTGDIRHRQRRDKVHGGVYLFSRSRKWVLSPTLRLADGSAHCARQSSYPEAIPTVDEGSFTLNLPAHDGPFLRVGVRDVSGETLIDCND